VDDIGYLEPTQILSLSDAKLREWVREFEERRYGGWRNQDNRWRESLGLDDTEGKHVIDFGCGFGIEALQFAKTGNRVTLIDLTDSGLKAARRVLNVFGYDAATRKPRAPFPEADIFYSNGVLHHTPKMPRIMERAARACQEARLLLYSDRAWRNRLGKEPGAPDDPSFVRSMDEVGDYADTYTPAKLEAACPDWRLVRSEYITPGGSYLTATLHRG
jgi:SAM-dependent methyltransferase